MFNINFTGKIIPVPAPASAGLDQLPTMRYEDKETGETESYTVQIVGSQVDVHIAIDRFDDEDVERHRNKSLDLARAALDLFNFCNGWGLSLYLDRYIGPDGKPIIIVPGHPSLSKLVTFDSPAIKGMFHVFAADARLHMAMNDLTQAITWPHVAPVNCARAIEGIRNIISPGVDKMVGWNNMRSALNLSEAYLKTITKLSEPSRHAKREWIPAKQLEDVIERSWIIMMRYMEWESRGEVPLPLSAFPLLF